MDTGERTTAVVKYTESLSGNIMALLFLAILDIFIDYIPSLLYGIVLWTMSKNCVNYGNAGKCGVIAAVCSFVTDVVFSDANEISILFGFPAAICALMCEYEEYCGHQVILADVAPDLSQKWAELWKWYIGAYGVTLVGVFAVIISEEIATIVAGGAAICLIIVVIVKMVYLYNTSKTLKNITEKSTSAS